MINQMSNSNISEMTPRQRLHNCYATKNCSEVMVWSASEKYESIGMFDFSYTARNPTLILMQATCSSGLCSTS